MLTLSWHRYLESRHEDSMGFVRYFVLILTLLLAISVPVRSDTADTDDDLLLMIPPIIAGAINRDYTGIYTGTWYFTNTRDGSSVSDVDPMIVEINSDGTINTVIGEIMPGTGIISGNTVTLYYPASSIGCSGYFKGVGTINGDKISGNIGPSTILCLGRAFVFTGPFAVEK